MNEKISNSYRIHLFFIFCIVLLTAYLGRIIFGNNGLYELQRMQQELTALKSENNRLENENIALYRVINRLKNDPEFIESIARQELQMIARDEIVFKFMENRGEASESPDLKELPDDGHQ